MDFLELDLQFDAGAGGLHHKQRLFSHSDITPDYSEWIVKLYQLLFKV
jgi:hypothetical protein